MKLKVGTKIQALEDCKMMYSSQYFVKKNKIYKIDAINTYEFRIKSECSNHHSCTLERFYHYFKIYTTLNKNIIIL